VDRIEDGHAALLQLVRQLAHAVLRLRDRQAVARDDDHVIGVGEHRRDVVDGRLPHAAVAVHAGG